MIAMRRAWLAVLLAACGSSASPDARTRIDGLPKPDAPTPDAALPRTMIDEPDDHPDSYQIHVLYVEPADRTADVALDTDGSIRRSLAAARAWFAYQTGGAALRFDTRDGDLDITYVKLPAPYTERAMATGMVGSPAGPEFLRDRLENLLTPTFHDPKKIYLVYWDGLSFRHCGGGPYPPSLIGHMPALFVGGVFASTFLTADASAGATTVPVYATSAMPFGAPPFTGLLGTEAIQVTAIGPTSFTLAAPLTSAHPAGEVFQAATTIPACRDNPFSPDGQRLAYWEYSAVHELMHTLGIVPPEGADYAALPVAPGHLAATGPDGTADLMYQGDAYWGCIEFPSPSSAVTAKCKLDSGHRNYFAVTGRSVSVDLARSVYLDPTPADAVLPPGW